MSSTTPLYSTIHRTPVGALTLIASDRGLRAILWPKESARDAGIQPRPRQDRAHPVLQKAAAQLDEYFAGTRTGFDLPLDLIGTDFQLAAWRSLGDIPFGETTTYGRQARALGHPTAARALGAANGANPVCIVLPCHRVIGADGSLTGFGGGLQRKAWLLDHEARVLARTLDSRWQAPAVQNALIHARGLTKRFGNLIAVDAIDFDVERGEAFGFLGPNGAGKTSTMRMIGCVSAASGGSLTVLGMNPVVDGPRIRARLGVVPQADTLDMELRVDENLLTYARYFDIPRDVARRRARELLEFVQLSDRARDDVEPLSGGMKRRLTIARALVNEPELLLLDEPTTGLDPQARHLVWDRLYRLKQQGVTIVLTTHYMDEAEQLCDRLVVMDKAKIVAFGSPRSLIEQYSTKEVLELRFPLDSAPAPDGKLEGIADRVEVLPDRVLLYTQDGDAATAAVHQRGLQPESTLVRRSTLEDVFLRLTGRSLIE